MEYELTYWVFLERQAGDEFLDVKELDDFACPEDAEQAARAFLEAATPPPEVTADGGLTTWVAEVKRGHYVDELGFPLSRDEAQRNGDAEWELDDSFSGAFLVQPQPPAVVAELNRRTEEMQRQAYREITGREPADAA